jgi:tetratricopeptide (TPR) repeat protein
MLQSKLARVLLVALLAGFPVAALGYWLYPGGFVDGRFRPTREQYLLAQGLHAVGQKDFLKAKELANLLKDRGYDNALHLLRGAIDLEEAKVATRKQRPPEDYLILQRAAQMVLAGAAAPTQTAVVRGPAWMAAGLVQTPVTVRVPLLAGCVRALAEVTQVQDDGELGDKATLVAGECLYMLHQYGLAAEGLEKLVKRDPDNRLAHYFLSLIYMHFDDAAKAKEHLRAWGELDAKDGVPYRWLGFYERKREIGEDAAIGAYQEALRRNLSDAMKAEVVEELVLLLRKQQDYETALEVIKQCPQRYAHKPEILALQVRTLLDTRQDEQAAKLLDDRLRADPGNRQALIQKGGYLLQRNQALAALPLLEKAAAIDPYDRVLQANLVSAYITLKSNAKSPEERRAYDERLRRETALQTQTTNIVRELLDMQANAKRQPGDVRIRYDLAMKALCINHYREARGWLEEALAINPNHRQAAAALSQLAAITGFQPRASGPPLQ